MELQVQRLKDRMGAGADDQADGDALALLGRWYALTPAQPAPDLDLRIQRVEAALRASVST
jgi:hypothetical protein